MLATLIALTLSQSASKHDLLECANYVDKTEQAACIAEFEAKQESEKRLRPQRVLSGCGSYAASSKN